MSIFTIGDLHLSFAPGIDKPMDDFGPRWFNHAERIKKNWCDIITDDDLVVIPGDISWGLKLEEAEYDFRWIDALPGYKLIFKGNHDLWWSGITKLNKMYDSIRFMQNDCYQIGDVYICGTRGWITPDDDKFTESDQKVYNREILRLEASLKMAKDDTCEILGFLHYPPVSHRDRYSGFQSLFEKYGVKNVYYGHVHGEDGFRNTIIGHYHGINYSLVSADYLNCMPIKIHE